jgi:hypothetical protein
LRIDVWHVEHVIQLLEPDVTIRQTERRKPNPWFTRYSVPLRRRSPPGCHMKVAPTYEELARRLKAHGHTENAASIANKLARGRFSATFFLAVLVAIGAEVVRLDDI